MIDHVVRDPTAESAPVARARRTPTVPLERARIGLYSIAKERSDEFIGYLQTHIEAHGYEVRRFAKATHTKTAAPAVLGEIVSECDVVVGALAD